MKIALCLSGKNKHGPKAFPLVYKNLLYGKEVDVFMHYWDEDLSVNSDCIKLYNPIKYASNKPFDPSIVDDYLPFCNRDPGVKLYNVYSMFYSMFYANFLKRQHELENSFRYDVVIRSRFDYALNTEISFESFDGSKLYAPNDWTPANRPDYILNDQFGYGGSMVMDLYSSVHTQWDQRVIDQSLFHGESLLGDTLKYGRFDRSRIEYLDMKCQFVEKGFKHSLIRDYH